MSILTLTDPKILLAIIDGTLPNRANTDLRGAVERERDIPDTMQDVYVNCRYSRKREGYYRHNAGRIRQLSLPVTTAFFSLPHVCQYRLPVTTTPYHHLLPLTAAFRLCLFRLQKY